MATITLTEDQVLKVKQALMNTPFAGRMPNSLTAENLVAYLADNAEHMKRVGNKYTGMETELRQLKADLRAVGRLLALTQAD